jgi:hypothetical protein
MRKTDDRAGRLLDGEELHLENERFARPDLTACPTVSVSELRRDEELEPGTDRHEFQGFTPTGNGLSFDLEARGLPTAIGTVELGPVDLGAPVVYWVVKDFMPEFTVETPEVEETT